MDDGSAYLSIHFDGERFGYPDTKAKIASVREFLNEMKQDLHVDTIVLSCCYPDAAKRILGEIPGITVLGSGNREVQTKYNSVRKIITVRSL